MKGRISIIKLVIGVMLVMGILGIMGLASGREINEEKGFSLKDIQEIRISMLNESVHVISTEPGGDLKLHLYGSAKSEVKLLCETGGGRVVVRDSRSRCSALEGLSLAIYIPGDYAKALLVEATSGKLDIGSINTGSLEAKSTSGDICMDGCSAGSIKAGTTSGKVIISSRELKSEHIDIATTSGDISLELTESAEFLVKARTNAGRIKTDFYGIAAGNSGKRSMEVQMGEGGTEIVLRTSSGSIEINKRES